MKNFYLKTLKKAQKWSGVRTNRMDCMNSTGSGNPWLDLTLESHCSMCQGTGKTLKPNKSDLIISTIWCQTEWYYELTLPYLDIYWSGRVGI